jgi:hypothetical protein
MVPSRTEFVIQAADLTNMSFRCQCGTAITFSATQPNVSVWDGRCPSCGRAMNGLATTRAEFERFLASATAEDGPTLEFRIALRESDKVNI